MATEEPSVDPLNPLKKFIGQRQRISNGGLYYLEGLPNTEANADNIRRFCIGAGDLNPLWLDEDYASKSPWRGLIPSPTWLYSVDWGLPPNFAMGMGTATRPQASQSAGGGIGGYAGSDWTFHEVVRLGDRFYIEKYLRSVEEKNTRTLGPTRFITAVTEFYRQDGVLVATLIGSMIGAMRSGQELEGARVALKKLALPEPEGKLPDEALQNVTRRGSDPRCWEDVEVGEEITPLSKGQATVAETARWFGMSGSRPLRTRNGDHASPHYIVERAQQAGYPTSFDEGPQRSTWMGQAVTDWMGDAGVLRRLKVKLDGFNFVGRSTTIHGKVSGKALDNDEPLVELELWAEHGDGTPYTSGQATVRLPRRSAITPATS